MDISTSLLTPPVSPDGKRPERQAAETVAVPRLTAALLEELLGNRGTKCPSLTKKNELCENDSQNDNGPDIQSQLDIILPLTQESRKLRRELEIYVELRQCYVHANRSSARATADRLIHHFPGSPSVTMQIERALCYYSQYCMFTKKWSHRGKNRSELRGGCKVQNYEKTIPIVAKAAVDSVRRGESERRNMDFFLEVLACNALCKAHQSYRGRLIKEWKEKISIILKRGERQVTLPPDAATVEHPATVVDNESQVAAITVLPEEKSGEKGHQAGEADHKRDPAKYWPSKFDERGFELPRTYTRKSAVSSYKKVKDKLLQELKFGSKDLKEGFVYMYKVKGHDNLVKIGYTARSIAERHEEWAFDCNREVIGKYPEGKDVRKLKYAYLLERLCHAQLAHCNVEVYCDACIRGHKEWFDIDTNKAIAILKNWSKWLESQPYEKKLNQDKESMARHKFVWGLKFEHEKQLDDMASFMQRLSLSTESDTTQAEVEASKAD